MLRKILAFKMLHLLSILFSYLKTGLKQVYKQLKGIYNCYSFPNRSSRISHKSLHCAVMTRVFWKPLFLPLVLLYGIQTTL